MNMQLRDAFLPLVLGALSQAAFAQEPAHLGAHARVLPSGLEVHAELRGASGRAFTLLAAPHDDGPFDTGRAIVLGKGRLHRDGSGSWSGLLPRTRGIDVELCAIYRAGASVAHSSEARLPLGGASECFELDVDYSNGPDEPVAGQIIHDEWLLAGVRVSADSAFGGSPDLAIVFDSGEVTGGDTDLATPGYGPGNDTALGNLLILAENDIGAEDGFVDDPDDDAGGGVIAFEFLFGPAKVCSITLVDIDDALPTELRFHHTGGGMETIPVPNLGDNSVQRLVFHQEDLTRMEVAFGGSGAIAGVEIAPCPIVLTFEESPFGIPLGFGAGLEITDQYAAMGLTISANNAVASHPDKAILFDSGHPTGEDEDLQTPGYGLNNDTPLGMILIIAEDDVDADMDDLVDDPDDEELGGQIFFDFDRDITFWGGTVLDVDGTERDAFRVYDGSGTLLASLDLENLGDNSVQRVALDTPVSGVRRVELVLGGSGAVTRLRWCPDDAGGVEE